MAGTSPFFSICIPAHNSFPLIEDALDSIESQTFGEWEVIIVDDCSDADVQTQLKQRKQSITNKIHCIRLNENKGPFYARRVAFRAARGTYVLCLDADDELASPTALEELYSVIEQPIKKPWMSCSSML